MNDVRDEVQKQAREAYLARTAPRAATIIVGTGGGKSKIAIDIIKELKPGKLLLLTNSETLRDTNWKAEFEKFEAMDYWQKTTSECYQTVYKWKEQYYDLVIADEIDFAMSPQYGKFFRNNHWGNLLGLTGFSTEDKKGLLQLHAPVCFEVTTQEMQNEGLLNKSKFIFIEYDLSVARTIEVKMKKGGHFYSSENDQYKYYDKEFQNSVIVKSSAEKKYKLFPSEQTQKAFASAEWNFKMTAMRRKNVLNSLNSSVKVVKALVEKILQNPENKVVIYSALTAQADKLGYTTYHGDADDSILEDLNTGKIRVLSVCKKLNRGVNLQGVNYIIKESFDGSETDFQQQHGRLMRLKPNQTATMIVMVPFFKQLIKVEEKGLIGSRVVSKIVRSETQAARWAENMMESFTNIDVSTIRMTADHKLPDMVSL